MKAAIVQIDQAGRVVLPKLLRERFRLRGGDSLAIEVKGDAIELRPTRTIGQLARINGVLVFTGGGMLEAGGDFAGQSREERIEDLIQRSGEGR
jgi:AbrB family looped-hinge helix DNA binding protein